MVYKTVFTRDEVIDELYVEYYDDGQDPVYLKVGNETDEVLKVYLLDGEYCLDVIDTYNGLIVNSLEYNDIDELVQDVIDVYELEDYIA